MDHRTFLGSGTVAPTSRGGRGLKHGGDRAEVEAAAGSAHL